MYCNTVGLNYNPGVFRHRLIKYTSMYLIYGFDKQASTGWLTVYGQNTPVTICHALLNRIYKEPL